jgi:aryl-alcohol dehydrogenase-like predicted oxidoreductase
LSIANVAVRWVLDHPFVGAVLIGDAFHLEFFIFLINLMAGTRLGVSEHLEDNQKVFRWRLSDEDNQDIENVLKQTNSRKMISSIGDCGAEYR